MSRGFTAALVAVVAVFGLVAAACSVQDGAGEGPPDRSATSAPSTSTSAPVEEAPEAESVGLLTIDDQAFDLTADCFAPGAGELLVLAVGDGVLVYAEAFLGAPYLGVEIDGALLEPSIDRPLEFSIDENVIRADDVLLVRDLDLESGESTAAGTGTLVVECRSYLDDLPDSFRR